MITPSGIPEIPGDMTALQDHAQRLQKLGSDVTTAGADVDSTWQGLAGVYDAPEAGELFAATGPVRTGTATLGDDLDAVGAALATYADTVADIKNQLATLRAQADAFVAQHAGDDDWHHDNAAVDQNNTLVNGVSAQVAAFNEAERACANAIDARFGGQQYRADDGDGKTEPGEYGATQKQLDKAAGESGALPWGSTQRKDRGPGGDVAAFFGGGWQAAKGSVGGLGALIGRDPNSGDWSWGTAGQSWEGMNTLALSFVPGAQTYNQFFGLPGVPKGALQQAQTNVAKNLVAWDDWGKGDNSRAAGEATFNIVSSVIGTKGAGAGVKGADAAADAARVSAASRAASIASKIGRVTDRLPTMQSVADRFGNLPDFRDRGPGVVERVDPAGGVRLGPEVRTTDPPPLEVARTQIETKYQDHAGDFGVTEPRGKDGFVQFEAAVRAVVDDPNTIHIDGTYRSDPMILHYNPQQHLVVLQLHDGTFVSGWRLNAEQEMNVVERGKL
jgi:Colicin D